jgi:hypothetical protein
MVYALSNEIGINKSVIDDEIYAMMNSFWAEGEFAKNSNIPIDENQLKKGIDVEYEHTNNYYISKKIACDHLSEGPRYYDYLEKMENEMEYKSESKK